MTSAAEAQVQLRLKNAQQALQRDFGGMFPAERIGAMFDDSLEQIRGESVFDDYIPALAERLARDRLKAAAQAEGIIVKTVPEVVFVAVHDTGRGRMGAAMMRSIAGARISVHSAGTGALRTPVEPAVEEAMREIGIPLDEAYSKPLTAEVLAAADVVVTMSQSTGLIEIPEGMRHVDWRIGNPGGAPLDEVRRIRDEILIRVTELTAELAPLDDGEAEESVGEGPRS